LGGLNITHFSDEDDIRVRAQERPHDAAKIQTNRILNLHCSTRLGNFNRIFHVQIFLFRRVDPP
jgi:hypothetical protein